MFLKVETPFSSPLEINCFTVWHRINKNYYSCPQQNWDFKLKLVFLTNSKLLASINSPYHDQSFKIKTTLHFFLHPHTFRRGHKMVCRKLKNHIKVGFKFPRYPNNLVEMFHFTSRRQLTRHKNLTGYSFQSKTRSRHMNYNVSIMTLNVFFSFCKYSWIPSIVFILIVEKKSSTKCSIFKFWLHDIS